MTEFDRGDVVLVDLGMVAKTRPCVVISTRQPARRRNLAVVVPLTTQKVMDATARMLGLASPRERT